MVGDQFQQTMLNGPASSNGWSSLRNFVISPLLSVTSKRTKILYTFFFSSRVAREILQRYWDAKCAWKCILPSMVHPIIEGYDRGYLGESKKFNQRWEWEGGRACQRWMLIETVHLWEEAIVSDTHFRITFRLRATAGVATPWQRRSYPSLEYTNSLMRKIQILQISSEIMCSGHKQ